MPKLSPQRPELRLTGKAQPENRRRAGRIRTLGVACSLGEVADVSASGMRVIARCWTPLVVGRETSITIAAPAGLLSVKVRLAWVRRNKWYGVHLGLQFVNPSAEVLEGVRSILRGCSIGPVEAEAMMRRKVA
jgi:hypothetical protein